MGTAIPLTNERWATRSVVYVHLIPPGAADTAHYRLHIPESAGDKISLHAKLNYRKFTWFNTYFRLRRRATRSLLEILR